MEEKACCEKFGMPVLANEFCLYLVEIKVCSGELRARAQELDDIVNTFCRVKPGEKDPKALNRLTDSILDGGLYIDSYEPMLELLNKITDSVNALRHFWPEEAMVEVDEVHKLQLESRTTP